VRCEFRYRGVRPELFASARCLVTGKTFFSTFILDTGACRTCLPASSAVYFGRSNSAPDVEIYETAGLGGSCKGYIHGFKFGLINPDLPPCPTKNAPIWEASRNEICFMEALNVGLIGMDVVSEWKKLEIIPNARGGGIIRIET
jgi:hypothetical protein